MIRFASLTTYQAGRANPCTDGEISQLSVEQIPGAVYPRISYNSSGSSGRENRRLEHGRHEWRPLLTMPNISIGVPPTRVICCVTLKTRSCARRSPRSSGSTRAWQNVRSNLRPGLGLHRRCGFYVHGNGSPISRMRWFRFSDAPFWMGLFGSLRVGFSGVSGLSEFVRLPVRVLPSAP